MPSVSIDRPPLPALTSVRFFAALAVVVAHYRAFLVPHRYVSWFEIGEPAVGLFFVLSGFILTYTYWGRLEHMRWLEFMHLRLARIVPMHVVAMIAVIPFAASREFDLFGWRWATASWWLNLVCLESWLPRPEVLWRWNGPAWSIGCELFFYAWFPLLLQLVAKLNTLRQLLFTVAAVLLLEAAIFLTGFRTAMHLYAAGHLPWFQNAFEAGHMILTANPVVRGGEFVAGILLGLIFLRYRRESPASSAPWSDFGRTLLLMACVTASAAIVRHQWLSTKALAARIFLLFVPIFLVFIAALAWGPNLFSWVLEHPSIVLLGESSYSLYLLHYSGFFVLGAVARASGHSYQPLLASAFVLVFIALSLATHRWIETPSRLAWRKRVTRFASAAVAAAR